MHKILDAILMFFHMIIWTIVFFTIIILYLMTVNTFYSYVLIMPFLLFWLWIHTIVHEIGHLTGGWISGYTFRQIQIGCFIIYKDAAGALRIYWLKFWAIGRKHLMDPPVPEAEQCPYILYLLGGSLLNLFIGILALLLYVFLLPHNSFTYLAIAEMGLTSIYIGILNLFPGKYGIFTNDGYNIALLSNPTAKTLWHLSQEVDVSLYQIDSMKDFPSWITDRLKNMHWPHLARYQAHILYAFLARLYLAEGNFDACYNHHLKILSTDGIPKGYKYGSLCECLFYEILRGASPDVIDNLYNHQLQKFVQSTRNTPAMRRLLFAYYHLYKRDEAKAAQQYKQLKQLSGHHLPPAELNMELQLVEQLAAITPAELPPYKETSS